MMQDFQVEKKTRAAIQLTLVKLGMELSCSRSFTWMAKPGGGRGGKGSMCSKTQVPGGSPHTLAGKCTSEQDAC